MIIYTPAVLCALLVSHALARGSAVDTEEVAVRGSGKDRLNPNDMLFETILDQLEAELENGEQDMLQLDKRALELAAALQMRAGASVGVGVGVQGNEAGTTGGGGGAGVGVGVGVGGNANGGTATPAGDAGVGVGVGVGVTGTSTGEGNVAVSVGVGVTGTLPNLFTNGATLPQVSEATPGAPGGGAGVSVGVGVTGEPGSTGGSAGVSVGVGVTGSLGLPSLQPPAAPTSPTETSHAAQTTAPHTAAATIHSQAVATEASRAATQPVQSNGNGQATHTSVNVPAGTPQAPGPTVPSPAGEPPTRAQSGITAFTTNAPPVASTPPAATSHAGSVAGPPAGAPPPGGETRTFAVVGEVSGNARNGYTSFFSHFTTILLGEPSFSWTTIGSFPAVVTAAPSTITVPGRVFTVTDSALAFPTTLVSPAFGPNCHFAPLFSAIGNVPLACAERGAMPVLQGAGPPQGCNLAPVFSAIQSLRQNCITGTGLPPRTTSV